MPTLASRVFSPEALRSCRLRLGWSRTDLAHAADMGYPTVARFESGTGNPNLRNTARLAAALGVTVDELLVDEKDTGT